jgi:pimeloyl-ACP methyl ester carboxylesterase
MSTPYQTMFREGIMPETGVPKSMGAKMLIGTTLLLGAGALIVRGQTNAAERKYPATGAFVSAHGARLHYKSSGSGRPVVFLHGNGVTLDDMVISGIVAQTAATHHAIAFDRPGFGHSSRPRGQSWSATIEAAAFAHAFRILGLDRPIIVAHSYATLVALALALDHPESVGGLVLVSGYYFPTARVDAVAFSPPAIPVVGDVLNYTVAPIAGELLSPRLIAKMFEPCAVPQRFENEFPFALMFRPSQIRAASQDAVSMVPSAAAFSKRYAELTCPVAIVSGDSDKVVDPATQAQHLHRAITGSALEMVSGAGHMVHHKDPSAIARGISAVEEHALASQVPNF